MYKAESSSGYRLIPVSTTEVLNLLLRDGVVGFDYNIPCQVVNFQFIDYRHLPIFANHKDTFIGIST